MKKLGIIIISLCFLCSSCHLFYQEEEHLDVQIYFEESNVTVFKGGLGSFSLRIDPPDGLDYYTVDYSIANEEVASIYRADRRGVVFIGKDLGSTVITAKIDEAETAAVINVIDIP